MEIEIYLKHIFQEFAVTESISIGNRMADYNDWSAKYERNCGCRGNVAMPALDMYRINIQRVFLRPENFGGLLYDPTSATIFKIDKEAYRAVEALRSDKDIVALRNGEKPLDEFAKRHKFKVNEIDEFVGQLKELGLW